MPGFDVDSKKVETEKLEKAPERVDEIVEAIRQKKNPSLYCAGSVPLLKSYMVYPLFTHFAIGSNRFYATDTCISCGICAKVCPTGTISCRVTENRNGLILAFSALPVFIVVRCVR